MLGAADKEVAYDTGSSKCGQSQPYDAADAVEFDGQAHALEIAAVSFLHRFQ